MSTMAKRFSLRTSVAAGGAVLVAAALSTALAGRISPLCDDAFISLVYVKNLLAGQGLTFNGTLVQGYTNPLWVLLIAGLGRVGMALPAACHLLTVASAVLALGSTLLLAWRVGLSMFLGVFACFCLALSLDFVIYTGAGLETLLFAGLLNLLALLCLAQAPGLRHALGVGAIAGLLALCRPEGLVAVLLAPAFLAHKRPRLAPLAWATGLLVAGPWFAWAHGYYGDWLPNSFYAKAAHLTPGQVIKGLHYLFPHSPSGVLFAVVGAVALLMTWRTRARALALLALAWVGYVAVVGGDWMPGWRVLLPVAGPALVALLAGAAASWLHRRPAAILPVALLVALLAVRWGDPDTHRTLSVVVHYRTVLTSLGQWLGESVPPGTLIATNPAGFVPYYSGLPTIDMLGINDPYIARHPHIRRRLMIGHEIGNGPYVLARRPDLVIFGEAGRLLPFGFVSEAELWDMPAFRRQYSWRSIRLPGGEQCILWVRRGSGLPPPLDVR